MAESTEEFLRHESKFATKTLFPEDLLEDDYERTKDKLTNRELNGKNTNYDSLVNANNMLQKEFMLKESHLGPNQPWIKRNNSHDVNEHQSKIDRNRSDFHPDGTFLNTQLQSKKKLIQSNNLCNWKSCELNPNFPFVRDDARMMPKASNQDILPCSTVQGIASSKALSYKDSLIVTKSTIQEKSCNTQNKVNKHIDSKNKDICSIDNKIQVSASNDLQKESSCTLPVQQRMRTSHSFETQISSLQKLSSASLPGNNNITVVSVPACDVKLPVGDANSPVVPVCQWPADEHITLLQYIPDTKANFKKNSTTLQINKLDIYANPNPFNQVEDKSTSGISPLPKSSSLDVTRKCSEGSASSAYYGNNYGLKDNLLDATNKLQLTKSQSTTILKPSNNLVTSSDSINSSRLLSVSKECNSEKLTKTNVSNSGLSTGSLKPTINFSQSKIHSTENLTSIPEASPGLIAIKTAIPSFGKSTDDSVPQQNEPKFNNVSLSGGGSSSTSGLGSCSAKCLTSPSSNNHSTPSTLTLPVISVSPSPPCPSPSSLSPTLSTSNPSPSSSGGSSSYQSSRKKKATTSTRERTVRRMESNERERMRMHSLNDAFQVSCCLSGIFFVAYNQLYLGRALELQD